MRLVTFCVELIYFNFVSFILYRLLYKFSQFRFLTLDDYQYWRNVEECEESERILPLTGFEPPASGSGSCALSLDHGLSGFCSIMCFP